MARLREVVVVVVTKLGVDGITTRTLKLLLFGKVGFQGLEQRRILHSPVPKRTSLSKKHLLFKIAKEVERRQKGGIFGFRGTREPTKIRINEGEGRNNLLYAEANEMKSRKVVVCLKIKKRKEKLKGTESYRGVMDEWKRQRD